MLLLSDGTIVVQGAGTTFSWTKLAPDNKATYINGTWSSIAPMKTARLYFGSNVLPNGNLFVVGGEYSGSTGQKTLTNSGEIYNPSTNSWTSIAPFPLSTFGDDPTVVLSNGNILCGDIFSGTTYLYNPASNSWNQTGTKLRNDRSDEETWSLLPDGSVLSVDIFNPGHAQRYLPSTGQWVDAGNETVTLTDTNHGYEMGPGTLLPDGRYLQIGANGNTAIYSPTTNNWSAGPTLPAGMGADDAPGAMLPNGHFVFLADNTLFNAPTRMYDFDFTTNSLTDITPTGVLGTAFSSSPAFEDRMLVAPNGHLLLEIGGSPNIWDFAQSGSPDPAWRPTITTITQNTTTTFTLTGTQLTGISEGASYGDDAEMSTNFPIVRLTDTTTGQVSYAKTTGWTPGVATGNTISSVNFTLPNGTTNIGHELVSVIANGISSAQTTFQSGPSDIALSNSTIGDQSLPGTIVGTMQTIEFGSGHSFTYSLVNSGIDAADNSKFAIDASTGQLTITQSVDFAILSSYSIRIRSTDESGAYLEKVFTIKVISAPVLAGTNNLSYVRTQITTAICPNITITSSWRPTLSSATIALSIFSPTDDVLAFANNDGVKFGNITGTYNSTAGTLILRSPGATATISQFQEALRAVTYVDRNTANPILGIRPVTFRVSDGTLTSNSVKSYVTVANPNTSVVVTSSIASSVFGQAVTITATIGVARPGSGIPSAGTANVTFLDGNNVIQGTVTYGLANGKLLATITTTSLTPGYHAISAVYSGDANFQGSSSPALKQTVFHAGTATKLAATATTTRQGQSITLKATISAVGQGSGIPSAGTGTAAVTFLDGKNLIVGIVAYNIVNGQLVATLTTSNLTKGIHTITAAYSRDAFFLDSKSTPIKLTIA